MNKNTFDGHLYIWYREFDQMPKNRTSFYTFNEAQLFRCIVIKNKVYIDSKFYCHRDEWKNKWSDFGPVIALSKTE